MGNIINTCIRFKSKFHMGDAHFDEIDLLCIFALFFNEETKLLLSHNIISRIVDVTCIRFRGINADVSK